MFSAANLQPMTTKKQCKVRIWIEKLEEIVCFRIVKEVGDEIFILTRELNRWNAKINLENRQFEMGIDNIVKLRINLENSEKVTFSQNNMDSRKISYANTSESTQKETRCNILKHPQKLD